MSTHQLSQKEALDVIAAAPEAHAKTATDLETAAEAFERDALRKDRIALSRASITRRAAAQREATQLKGHAVVCRLAVREMRRRRALTVGDAVAPRLLRLLRGQR